ncbi:uncharacterized protein EV422DRAFT_531018 [Fimicolochytrium jonesii]|uniref:uncharacterized protein n=1 Tax=Fimicolochytrium jonesii TaxID=1396493 RepID=UPI0022FECFD2|nr:uncharacterized protein EV422DRAFT_531018 [Fimicolochytrium jonesii]KAI8820479.1 hypothetical protein EV422DRAFT_531018 [Fimicolochytrium jonesii]
MSRKKLRTAEPTGAGAAPTPTDFASGVFSDEILLHILAYLSHRDLTRLGTCSRTWHRLASDQTLWKRLFLRRFPLECLAQPIPAGSPPAGEVRVRRRTSGMAGPIMRERRDFLSMYILQHNWNAGNYVVTNIDVSLPVAAEPVLEPGGVRTATDIDCALPVSTSRHLGTAPITAFTKDVILVALASPDVAVWSINHRAALGSLSRISVEPSMVLPRVCCIQLESCSALGHPHLRVVAGYDDGSWTVWEMWGHDGLSQWGCKELITVTQAQRVGLVAVTMMDNIVVTCSSQFDVAFHRITNALKRDNTQRRWESTLIHRLRGSTCWPPVDLHLTRAGGKYALYIAYASPSYGNEWNVSLDQITFSRADGLISSKHFSPKTTKVPMTAEFTGIRFRHPYLVAPRRDNTVHVYTLSGAQLTHTTILYAHHAAVTALELDGVTAKLITGGIDGLKIWSLRNPVKPISTVDRDWIRQFEKEESLDQIKRPTYVGFDEGRIVSVSESLNGRLRSGTFCGMEERREIEAGPLVGLKIFSFLDES